MKCGVENRRESMPETAAITTMGKEASFGTLEESGRKGNEPSVRGLTHKVQSTLWPDPVIAVHDALQACTSPIWRNAVEAAVVTRPKALVIDDEPGFIIYAMSVLQKCGYEGQWAKDGDDAVERCRQAKENSSPFELILLGSSAAHSRFTEMLGTMRKIEPQVTLLAACADLAELPGILLRKSGLDGVLPKRFTRDDLDRFLPSAKEAGGTGLLSAGE